MATLYYTNQYISTTLSEAGGIDASQTDDITLGSVSGVETTKPGICCISYSDPIDTSKAEWITYTSIDASNKLVGATRGAEGFSAKAHSFGAVVAFPISKSHVNNINTDFVVEHDQDGTHLTTTNVFYNSLRTNCIINGGFTVNQRVYVSDATLASGAYGHDRWKAGTGGGDYTFTQLEQSTVITIKASKTLIQVIEPKNVVGGTYTLSWTGTAQARYKVDSATPDGAYADSPIAITGQTAGTVMSVEFDDGTLSEVVLNSGSVALPFMPKSFDQELYDCQRYYQKSYQYTVAPETASDSGVRVGVAIEALAGSTAGTITTSASNTLIKRMRTSPTVVLYDRSGTSDAITILTGADNRTGITATQSSETVLFRYLAISNADATAIGVGNRIQFHWTADAEL